MITKNTYCINYRDRHEKLCRTYISARSEEKAKLKFYKKDKYSLIESIREIKASVFY